MMNRKPRGAPGLLDGWTGWPGALRRGLLFAVGWWALNEGQRPGIGFGAVVVILAVAASMVVGPPRHATWRPLGLLGFVGFFLVRSLAGGLDVARRAVSPRMRIAPGLVRYRVRLPPGTARELFTGALSMMPGTLSVKSEGVHLDIHFLVGSADVSLYPIERLELWVARALGQELEGETDA
jgi:multicomponent Na+:H+ antiporter subunit E